MQINVYISPISPLYHQVAAVQINVHMDSASSHVNHRDVYSSAQKVRVRDRVRVRVRYSEPRTPNPEPRTPNPYPEPRTPTPDPYP